MARRWSFVLTLGIAALAAAPRAGRAGEGPLRLVLPQGLAAPDLSVRPAAVRLALAAGKASGGGAPSLDFDLLGEAPRPPAPPDDPSLRRRRKLLEWHQGLGIGLFAVQLGSTVTGQLNYGDKFGVSNTGRYKETHRYVTYTNLALFAGVGTLALLAPTEKNAPPRGFGRSTVHKIGMAVAAAGMLAQGVLGIRTAQREGYLDQQRYGRAHLAVGYATLAAMTVAVGVLVF